MTEQSHKREMTEALRGDFERLRARRRRPSQGGRTQSAASPERVVLTPPRRSVETVSALPEQPRADERRRSRLLSVFRRKD